MPVQDGADDRLRVVGFANISRHRGADLADLLSRCLEHVLTPTGDHDCRAAPGELGGGGLAEVRPPARDERDLARKEIVGEDSRRVRLYSPMTLMTSRFDR